MSTCVLAVPWWAHRRRRARVRVERLLAAWPEIAQAVGLAGSRVMSAVVDVWGWRAVFGLARGQTITDVIAKLPAIESGLGTFRGAARVCPTPDGLANRFELRVLDKDPHADAITWPGPSVALHHRAHRPRPVRRRHARARCSCYAVHGLFGGATGSGKSGGVNVLMGNLTACARCGDLGDRPQARHGARPVGRSASTAWPPRPPRPARCWPTRWPSSKPAPPTSPRSASGSGSPPRTWPALLIIIDEYAELTESASDATGDADSIGRRGRAVAVTLVAATQRPTQKAMGQGALRSQMDVRICFRVRERHDVDLILGQGMLAAGWQAHKLNAPGKFLISAPEHDTPRRARAYLLTDEAVSATASRARGSPARTGRGVPASPGRACAEPPIGRTR